MATTHVRRLVLLVLAGALAAWLLAGCRRDWCETSSDCPPDIPACDVDTCVECITSASCDDPARPYCAGDRACHACTEDEHCETACVALACVPCGPDVPCSDRRGCVAGACGACASDDECPTGTSCAGGLCAAVCADENECLELAVVAGWDGTPDTFPRAFFGCNFYSFNLAFGFCDGSPYYTSQSIVCAPCGAATCAPGQSCVAGNCTCATNADCPADLVCAADRCAPCRANDECDCEEFCSDGTCRPSCATDADCPGGRCDPASLRCAWCLSDLDCPAPAWCWEDGCEVPCQLENDCATECNTAVGRCEGCDGFYPGPPPAPPAPMCM